MLYEIQKKKEFLIPLYFFHEKDKVSQYNLENVDDNK